jgi:hypothetical protein
VLNRHWNACALAMALRRHLAGATMGNLVAMGALKNLSGMEQK